MPKTKTTAYTMCSHINIYFRVSCCNCSSFTKYCSASQILHSLASPKSFAYSFNSHICLNCIKTFKHNMHPSSSSFDSTKKYVNQQKLFLFMTGYLQKRTTRSQCCFYNGFIAYITLMDCHVKRIDIVNK